MLRTDESQLTTVRGFGNIRLDPFLAQYRNRSGEIVDIKGQEIHTFTVLREELGLDPDCKLVGMIGRLDKQKNPLDLIRTAAIVASRYSKVQFFIVGDGPLHSDCERLINELGLKEKFLLLGYRSDVPRIMSVLTITAMSSLWEGLPLVFLEAMSASKPIVANDVDGASR